MDDMVELRNTTRNVNKSEYQEVVYLKEAALIDLVGDEKENVWDTTGTSGCRVHVLSRRHHNEQGHRKVVLSGSPQAVKSTAAKLMETNARVRDDYPPFVPSWKLRVDNKLPVPLVRSIWADEPKSSVTDRSKHGSVFSIPQRREFTIRTFADHVAELTRPAPPHAVHRLLYPVGQNHNDIVRDTLYDLFSDPSKRPFFSTRAINLMIRFYYRHSYLPLLRALFPRIEDMMTARTFNILLEGVSRRKKLPIFQYYIRLMRRLDVQPNGLEWAHFLRLLDSSKARSHVVTRLREEGLLEDYGILQGIMKVLAPDYLLGHLDSGQPFQTYMNFMTQKFGGHWLDAAVIAEMFKAVAYRQNAQAVRDLANYCKQHNFPLNYYCLNMALLAFLKDHCHEGIEFYLWFKRNFRVSRDRETMRILFSISWRNKSYNTCRVLWRYACVEGTVSYGMQSVVFSSLLRNTRPETLDDKYDDKYDASWWSKAGKVITGLDLSSERFASKFETLKHRLPLGFQDNPQPYLCDYRPSGLERDLQLDLAKLILGDDMATLGNYVPVHHFDKMVSHAYAIDTTWKKTNNKTARELMQDAIHVPFEKGKAKENVYLEHAEDEEGYNAELSGEDEEGYDTQLLGEYEGEHDTELS